MLISYHPSALILSPLLDNILRAGIMEDSEWSVIVVINKVKALAAFTFPFLKN
jgi:hypothetical protein